MKTPLARHTDRVALAGILAAAFDGIHPFADQWCQRGHDATHKGLSGTHSVYLRDGSPVPPDALPEPFARTVSATAYGWLCSTRHVLAYSAAQTAAALLLTRLLGVRVKPSALAVGMLINAATHTVIDRRGPLHWLAGVVGKTKYIEHCPALRVNDEGEIVAEHGGPGSAAFELDQALHRAIGVFAAAVTAWMSTRGDR